MHNPSSPDFHIVYASQTGTSQTLAESLFRSALHKSYHPELYSISSYPFADFPNCNVPIIFLISTTGQGAPPSSMSSFWKFLLIKGLPGDCLKSLRFCIFGLGDRKYPQFNAMARKLQNRLLQLGASIILRTGLGDDSSERGVMGEWEGWREELWSKFEEECPFAKLRSKLPINYGWEVKRLTHELTERKVLKMERPIGSAEIAGKCIENGAFLCKIRCLDYLCCKEDRKVLKIDFEIPEEVLYKPGDSVFIYPQNDQELVLKLASLLDYQLTDVIEIKPKEYYIKKYIPEIVSIQDLFTFYLDIGSPPNRYFFEKAAAYTDNELHKEKLLEMGVGSKGEHLEEYYRYCVREKRNVYEVLFDFNSVRMPLDELIDCVGTVRAREYSISGYHTSQLSLTLALVEYKTLFGRSIKGLSSRFLSSLKKDDKIELWLRKGYFNFSYPSSPSVFIATGTGIAPFISYFEKLYTEKEKNGKQMIKLFFGCRKKNEDFIYETFLKEMEKEQLIELNVAYSRDGDKKHYVQHLIREKGEELAEFLDENVGSVNIYVCGTATFMPEQVKNSLTQILRDYYQEENKGWENSILQNFRNNSSISEVVKSFSSSTKEKSEYNLKLSKNSLNLSLLNSDIIHLNSFNPTNKTKFSLEKFVEVNVNHTNPSDFLVQESEEQISITPNDKNYKIVIQKSHFTIRITSFDEKTLFCEVNSRSCLANDPHPALDFFFDHTLLYGLPERVDKVILEDTTKDKPYRLNNYDRFISEALSKSTSYGSIPLIFSAEKGKFMCIYWANASKNYFDLKKTNNSTNLLCFSNAADLNCYLILATSLKDIYRKINHFFSQPPLPPYFSLGYHHSRWSFEDQKDIENLNAGFLKSQIPCDVLHLDIDYTVGFKYFTIDEKKFPTPKKLVNSLLENGRRLVVILDPHIKKQEGYFVYDEAAKNNYFVKDKDGKEDYTNVCWPGTSCWLDFLQKNVREFWKNLINDKRFLFSDRNVHVWNDMNEPSVFGADLPNVAMHGNAIQKYEEEGKEGLLEIEHEVMHNIYGYLQTQSTYQGLRERGIRGFLLTRAFFAGSQKYAATWTGDTGSSWETLGMTIPMLLGMASCGLSFCGGDVGGFVGDPDEELLIRWYQSGIFYPFFRGHSTINTRRREPWLYSSQAEKMMKEAILLRYRLLPYIYTAFYRYTQDGYPIIRPVWMDFGKNYGTEEQILFGDSLLASPIVSQYQTSVDLRDVDSSSWYCFFTLRKIKKNEKIEAKLDYIPLFIKEGSMIIQWNIKADHNIRSTKDLFDLCQYKLTICLDSKREARGNFYIDDGESFHYEKNVKLEGEYLFQNGTIIYETSEQLYYHKNLVETIEIAGLPEEILKSLELKSNWILRENVLLIKDLELQMTKPWEIKIY